eukprot:TRINITY_DN5554_c0_g1_i5.p1 TRINITY_DN5554_c0_g1~~TRINITY_DN5554_c0_g1_i5.p1  ORF type:complete len:215 (-),score=-11.26 TRINITY_DN5554_c0_g1_i5:393-1037(-)
MQLVEKSVENWQNFMQCFVTSLLKVQVILKVVNLVFEQNFMNIYLYLFRYISQQKTRFYAIVVMHIPFQTKASKNLTKSKWLSWLMRDGKNNLQCMHIKLVEFCSNFWHNPPLYVDLLLVFSNLPWNNSTVELTQLVPAQFKISHKSNILVQNFGPKQKNSYDFCCIVKTFTQLGHFPKNFWSLAIRTKWTTLYYHCCIGQNDECFSERIVNYV